MWMYQGKGHMWTTHPLSNPWDHCLCVVWTMKDVISIDKIKTAESLVNDLYRHRQWSPNMIVVYFLSMIDGDYLVACWVVGIMQIWALCWKMRAHISPFTFGKYDKGGKPIEIILTSMVIPHLYRTLRAEGFPTVQHFPMLFRVWVEVDDCDHLFIIVIVFRVKSSK